MTYSIEWLKEKSGTDERLRYLLFWGHQPAKDGSITASCFSQWWPSPFEKDGQTYATAEHWMMAAKARLFNDEEIVQKIVRAEHPSEAKKLGRKVSGFDPERWDLEKFALVVEGNRLKFSQEARLREFLLNTGDRVLVEASPVDAIWGIGLAANDPRSEHPEQWRGENLLGFALMEVRDLLKRSA
jgi:ribA/ribD-fused uncharacterized protein